MDTSPRLATTSGGAGVDSVLDSLDSVLDSLDPASGVSTATEATTAVELMLAVVG
jgi:hypothetical protein